MSQKRTGWIAVQGTIVGNLESHSNSYYWDGKVHPTRAYAISQGFRTFGHDDFNVGHLIDDVLVWWGWMDEQIIEDLASVAADLGFAPVDSEDPK